MANPRMEAEPVVEKAVYYIHSFDNIKYRRPILINYFLFNDSKILLVAIALFPCIDFRKLLLCSDFNVILKRGCFFLERMLQPDKK